jgi:hypothetical protein
MFVPRHAVIAFVSLAYHVGCKSMTPALCVKQLKGEKFDVLGSKPLKHNVQTIIRDENHQ